MVKTVNNQSYPIADCPVRRETENVSLALYLKTQNLASEFQSGSEREGTENLYDLSPEQHIKDQSAAKVGQNIPQASTCDPTNSCFAQHAAKQTFTAQKAGAIQRPNSSLIEINGLNLANWSAPTAEKFDATKAQVDTIEDKIG